MRDKFDKPVVGNLFFKEDLFDSHKFTFSQKKIIWCLLRGIYDYYIEIDEKKVIAEIKKYFGAESSLLQLFSVAFGFQQKYPSQ
jgi:hypothetical protein